MPPSPIQRTIELVRAEAQRLLQSYIGSRPGRDVQPVVERRLRVTLREEFGITLPIEDIAGAAERILREISVPPQQPVARPMGGIPVDRILMDEATWRDILGWGLTTSVQAPLQISHVTPQPLNYRSATEERMAAEAMAEEDRRIFEALDQIGREGFERTPDNPRIDFSWVPNPTDPMAMIQLSATSPHPLRGMIPPGEVWAISDPEFVGRMPIGAEVAVLRADTSRPATIGFMAHEVVGEVRVNPRAAEILQGRRVTIPEFEIASSPTIRLDDIQARRFDLFERGHDRKAVLMALVVWEAVLAAKRLPTVTPPETRPEF